MVEIYSETRAEFQQMRDLTDQKLGQQKRGPGKLPRGFKYASNNETGKTGCCL